MPQAIDHLILDALTQPANAVFYHLSRSLQKTFPEKALLETEDWSFQPLEFAYEGQCQITFKRDIHSEFERSWAGKEHADQVELYNSWLKLEWKGREFEVIVTGKDAGHSRDKRSFILGESESAVRELFCAVCAWCSEVRGEVLTFSGCWSKSKDLYDSIKGTTLESLVLEGTLKEELRNDFLAFFDSRETYDRYKIAWKRGVLLLGPPGNGKTHAIKGLVNLLGKPCLYVKSFKHQYSTDHECIRQVFKRARSTAPCILVLEDLDSIIDKNNRSFFLNEMDGFASNAGIMTVATTNHPERLDPAILERPSRFDRKYTFNLPNTECRATYIDFCNQPLEEAMKLDVEAIERIAADTEGFSYAYLKELFLSAMMLWISAPGERSLGDLMASQVGTLLQQMTTAAPLSAHQESDDDEDQDSEIGSRSMRRWRR